MPLRTQDVIELKEKYEQMLGMRIADAENPGGDPRPAMVALARRFPGALREIDEAPLELLRARRDALLRRLGDIDAEEPWMEATFHFHRLLRGALAAKKWLGGRRSLDRSTRTDFEDAIRRGTEAEDAMTWSSDLERVAAPPRGRLTALVFDRLAADLGVPVDVARARVLLPSPRAARHGVR